jgi:hypothetical protein
MDASWRELGDTRRKWEMMIVGVMRGSGDSDGHGRKRYMSIVTMDMAIRIE